jgi:hypothetical protein
MTNKVYFTVDRRAVDGAMQLSINVDSADGGGHGYRIAGPKYDGNGKVVLRHELSDRDVSELRRYLALSRPHQSPTPEK